MSKFELGEGTEIPYVDLKSFSALVGIYLEIMADYSLSDASFWSLWLLKINNLSQE